LEKFRISENSGAIFLFYVNFVTKLSLQVEIYAKNGFLYPKELILKQKIATSIYNFNASLATGKNFDAAPSVGDPDPVGSEPF
jgi:hypothetical protein